MIQEIVCHDRKGTMVGMARTMWRGVWRGCLHHISFQKAESAGQMTGHGCNPQCLFSSRPDLLARPPKGSTISQKSVTPNIKPEPMEDIWYLSHNRNQASSFKSHRNVRNPLWVTAVASLNLRRLKYYVQEAHISHITPGQLQVGSYFLASQLRFSSQCILLENQCS